MPKITTAELLSKINHTNYCEDYLTPWLSNNPKKYDILLMVLPKISNDTVKQYIYKALFDRAPHDTFILLFDQLERCEQMKFVETYQTALIANPAKLKKYKGIFSMCKEQSVVSIAKPLPWQDRDQHAAIHFCLQTSSIEEKTKHIALYTQSESAAMLYALITEERETEYHIEKRFSEKDIHPLLKAYSTTYQDPLLLSINVENVYAELPDDCSLVCLLGARHIIEHEIRSMTPNEFETILTSFRKTYDPIAQLKVVSTLFKNVRVYNYFKKYMKPMNNGLEYQDDIHFVYLLTCMLMQQLSEKELDFLTTVAKTTSISGYDKPLLEILTSLLDLSDKDITSITVECDLLGIDVNSLSHRQVSAQQWRLLNQWIFDKVTPTLSSEINVIL